MPPGAGLLFILWWLTWIGSVICVIAFVVAVWRIAMAHENMAETLRVALLGQRPEPSLPEYGPAKTAKCLLCQATIPAGQIKCPECSWSYEDAPAKAAERLKGQGKL
jgi:hypothetical protein